jgi:hypothetical protein
MPDSTRRDAAAATPLSALDLEGPPAFLDPPGAARPQTDLGNLVAARPRPPTRPGPAPITRMPADR